MPRSNSNNPSRRSKPLTFVKVRYAFPLDKCSSLARLITARPNINLHSLGFNEGSSPDCASVGGGRQRSLAYTQRVSRLLRKHEATASLCFNNTQNVKKFFCQTVRAVTIPPRPLASRQGGAPLRYAIKGVISLLYIRYLVRASRSASLSTLTHTKTSQHPPTSQNLYNFAKLDIF